MTTATETTTAAGKNGTPRKLTEAGKTRARLVPVPGVDGVMVDLEPGREHMIRRQGDTEVLFLDWAPRLLTWWTDPEGVPIYQVTVKGQEEYVTPETLRDGTAWDQFDHAAGHDVRKVREALAGVVKLQRRDIPKAPGLDSLGWHDINDSWVYVSADRAFGPAGEVAVNVNTYSSDEATLPEAPTGDRLRDVVALSLSVLDVAPLRVSAPAMCSTWLAPLISLFGNDLPRFVPWMWSDGRAQVFGVLKSSLAAILQAHSGTGYRGEGDLLPAADTSLPSLSGILGERRDGLVIVDDYKPGETSAVDNKTQGTAEQGIRAATNRQKRSKNRMRGPGRAKVSACMALLMYTAECLPLFNSGSTHDRTFPFQVHKGDVRSDRLTVLQDRVDEFPEAAAGYAAWLAAHHAEVTAFLAGRFRELRADLRTGQEVTGRACSHIAHLLCAAEVFTRFAVEAGALTDDRRNVMYGEIRAALIEAATTTTTERTEDQPHEVWLRNLRGLFASGKLFAINPGTASESPVQYADALGWAVERRDVLAGYARPDGLAVVESEVNPAITRRDKSLTIGGVQLRRLLAARGIIRPQEHPDGKHDHLHRVRVGSSRLWLMVIPWEVFLGTDGDTAPEGGQEGQGDPQAPEGPAAPQVCNGYSFGKPCGLPLDPAGDDGNGRHSNCVPAPARPAPAAMLPAPMDLEPNRPALPGPRLVTEAAPAEAVRQVDDVPAPSDDVRPSRPARKAAPARLTMTLDGPHADYLEAARTRKSIKNQAQVRALAERLVYLDESEAELRPLDPETDEFAEALQKRVRGLRLLAALEGDKEGHGPFAPYRSRRGPWWQPDMPGMIEAARVLNSWSWQREDFTGEAVSLDRNGAWPTAVSSVRVAHGALENTGPIEEVRGAPRPGYYKVTVYPWTEAGVPSPMGNEPVGSEAWITAPHMHLLVDLAEAGRWPDASALDSYTGEAVRLTDWAHLVGEVRRYALEVHGRDSSAYEVAKESFGMAVNSMYGSWHGEGAVMRRKWICKSRRVDWAHHIKDQAAVTIWRAADAVRQTVPADLAPLTIRSMDELVIPAAVLETVTTAPEGERPLIRLDDLGTTFGTWKVKGDTEAWGDE
ncbi:hypothetical protein [[Kitasatospora] papulosa]|uniref:hypothetical protein n=1 Tax=[Kitasatospora] papulosa TaxID=1464011 RepID=UPI003711C9C1